MIVQLYIAVARPRLEQAAGMLAADLGVGRAQGQIAHHVLDTDAAVIRTRVDVGPHAANVDLAVCRRNFDLYMIWNSNRECHATMPIPLARNLDVNFQDARHLFRADAHRADQLCRRDRTFGPSLLGGRHFDVVTLLADDRSSAVGVVNVNDVLFGHLEQ